MVCRIQPEGNAACGIAHLVHKDMYVFGVEGAPGLYMVFEFFDCHTAISSSCTKIAVYDKKWRNNSTEDCACFTEKVPKKQRKVLKKNIRKNGAIELGKTATAILNAIIVQPTVTREMLAEQLKISDATIKKHLKNFRAMGLIERVGPNKGGHWKVKK